MVSFHPLQIVKILFLLLISQACIAQIKVNKLDRKDIPKSIKIYGHIINSVYWTDSLGENIVITSETGKTPSKNMEDDSYRDAALYALHYIKKDDSLKLSWKVYDFIKECPVDLKASFIKNTFSITDLDKNNIAEVWLMYKIVCHGDVSPSDMKIIMYEGDKKYAVRGTNRVQLSTKESIGGEYKFDEAFKNTLGVFRQFATQLWKKNVLEKWD